MTMFRGSLALHLPILNTLDTNESFFNIYADHKH